MVKHGIDCLWRLNILHFITHCTILGSSAGLARMATVNTILYVYLFTNVVARVIYTYFCLGQFADLLRSWFSRKRVRAQWFWAVSANARGQPPDPNSGFQSSASKTRHNKHLIFIFGGGPQFLGLLFSLRVRAVYTFFLFGRASRSGQDLDFLEK